MAAAALDEESRRRHSAVMAEKSRTEK